MDITAKHAAPDKDGVRIAGLNEESFRYLLWDHKPLTDFWQVGPGTVRRLEKHGIHTMGELARASLYSEDMLYREFGVDAEILIDHAWGIEPCGMKEINAYRPESNSICEGQVLSCPYDYEKNAAHRPGNDGQPGLPADGQGSCHRRPDFGYRLRPGKLRQGRLSRPGAHRPVRPYSAQTRPWQCPVGVGYQSGQPAAGRGRGAVRPHRRPQADSPPPDPHR